VVGLALLRRPWSPPRSVALAREENEALRAKTAQVFELGCRAVAVLFDDIPAKMVCARPRAHSRRARRSHCASQVDADRAAFASVAEAQCHVANTLLSALEALAASRGEAPPRLLFCPTEYCQSMAKHEHMRSPYLEAVGRLLRDEIDVFWTGPAIISEKLPAAHLAQVASVLRRPPMIWDNLFANDYDSRRTFLGPYDGRDAATAAAVRGVVINPNCEFELNFVALRTFARFVREPATYAPAEALATARDEWRRRMGVGGGRVVGEEEAGLLCDLFFLPHRHGPRAARLLDLVAAAIARKARGESDGGDEARELASLLQSVERLFVLVTELEDRPLCYALYRYLWTVKEECIAVERFLAHAAPDPSGRLALRSAEFPPRVFRGGFIADLQRLLEFERDGALCAAPLAK
jgi:protein O-GlcNAcase/histone acetyltransferase